MLWMNPHYEAAFRSASGDPYDAAARLLPSDHFKEKQGRSTGRYEIQVEGRTVGVYLKKYPNLPWWTRWLAPERSFPGPHELAKLRQVEQLGIRVPDPVLAGSDRNHACQSLFGTRELEGFEPLHKYIPAAFTGTLTAEKSKLKRRLIERLAEVARKLHRADWYHCDFYLCHFYLREDPSLPDGFELALIDLMRLTHSRRRRWRVKDLAQLLFSSALPGVTSADRLRFFKLYLGIRRLNSGTRELLREVFWKAEGYHWHNQAAPARNDVVRKTLFHLKRLVRASLSLVLPSRQRSSARA
ncbi:MAG: hypothetical protein N2C14_11140 [Planctomycetales bacterium]